MYEIDDLRLMKLRNPWGLPKSWLKESKFNDWRGDFSDEDDKNWTKSLKEKLHYNPTQFDGIFYMPYKDFTQYFDTLYICHYKEDYYFSSLPDANKSKDFACYQFSITTPGIYTFGLSQIDKRKHGNRHKYGHLALIIFRKTEEKVEYVCGKGQEYEDRDVWVKSEYSSGQYIAFVLTTWNAYSLNENKFSFWCYGPKPLKMVRISKEMNLVMCSEIFNEGIEDYVIIF